MHYNSHAERVAAESSAGRERLDRHTKGLSPGTEKAIVRPARAGDENVISDGGKPSGPVNAESYEQAVEQAKAQNPALAHEIFPGAEVKPKKRKTVDAAEALANLQEILG